MQFLPLMSGPLNLLFNISVNTQFATLEPTYISPVSSSSGALLTVFVRCDKQCLRFSLARLTACLELYFVCFFRLEFIANVAHNFRASNIFCENHVAIKNYCYDVIDDRHAAVFKRGLPHKNDGIASLVCSNIAGWSWWY